LHEMIDVAFACPAIWVASDFARLYESSFKRNPKSLSMELIR